MPVGNPAARKLQTPAARNLQTPAARNLQTPAGRKLQTPAASNNQTPAGRNQSAAKKLQTPAVSNLQTPAGRKLQISAATIAPTVPKFAVGTDIEARWKGGIKYYRGKIDKINADGTYAIQHYDGDYARSVIAAHIRPFPPPKKRSKPQSQTAPLSKKVTTIKVGFKVQRNDRNGFIKKVHGNSTFDVEYYDGLTECDLKAYQFRVLSRTINGRTEPKIDAEAEQTHKQTELAKRLAKVGEQLELKSKKSWYDPFGFFSS